jgi:hypothetical protein
MILSEQRKTAKSIYKGKGCQRIILAIITKKYHAEKNNLS